MLDYGIWSHMNREDLYAELSEDGRQWGEISIDKVNNKLILTIYPTDNPESLRFDYLEFVALLEKARQRLCKIEGSPNIRGCEDCSSRNISETDISGTHY